jgi:prepilin-type N-terminal cleavage/methylation domain-containing protein
MNNKKGFTLIELIIVIVIVGVLTAVSVPIYAGYVQRAKWAEGKALAAAILTAQKVYYSENGTWYEIGSWVENDNVVATDARWNKFFRKYKTGISDIYTNVMCAAVFSENDNIVLYQFWRKELSLPASYPRYLVTDSSGKHLSEEW